MNIKEISHFLDNIQICESDYEFDNFFLETFPTKARQLIAVMRKIEKLSSELDSDRTLKLTDMRTIKTKTQQLTRLTNWYNSISIEDKQNILKQYEDEEPIYWANILGRRAAIEILTKQHASVETMDQMSNLPENDFIEAVRICTKYLSLIKNTTEFAENSITTSISGMSQV